MRYSRQHCLHEAAEPALKDWMAIGGKWSMAWGHSPGMRVSAPPPPHNQSRGIKPARHCALLHDWCLSTSAAQGRKIILKDSCTFWRSEWFSHSVVDLRPVLTSKGGGAKKRFERFFVVVLWERKSFESCQSYEDFNLWFPWQHGIILKIGTIWQLCYWILHK